MSELEIFRPKGVVSAEEMQAINRNADDYGCLPSNRMEQAGKTLANALEKESENTIIFFCGSGNNGGNGYVAARLLKDRKNVTVFSLGAKTPEADAALTILKASGLKIKTELPGLTKNAVLVDCLLGTGEKPSLQESMHAIVEAMNASGARIVSCDIETSGIHADRVIAFHLAKTKRDEVYPIGIPEEADIFCGEGDLMIIPKKEKNAHKGAGGTILVIGGGPYQGAPFLAGSAALRAGADIVRVASPVDGFMPDLILERLSGTKITKEHEEKLITLAEATDIVIAGPGLGTDGESLAVVRTAVTHAKHAVIDADLLRNPLPKAKGATIYTPHIGEFTRLFGKLPDSLKDRGLAVQKAAREADGVILLKGKTDIISDGYRVKFNTSGCAAMSVGGTGDILAGITGGLLARMGAFPAACAAAYAEGKTGEKAAETVGEGLIASDLLVKIAEVLWKS
ncbi:MAG TPA: NAD(P)H-hydrate dehydratase [Methanocorpusculum sp.]|nr:NAD(P)H-hydrate dehydratase [Methanocorpusculum sp.]